jgi:hypothetical protein
MTNMLKTGLDYLAQQLKAHASESVVYSRGTNTVTLAAVLGKTVLELQDESGFAVGAATIDFIFCSQDLVLNQQMVTPLAGDRITTGRAVYEVHHIAHEGCWKYSDPFGKQIRVHVKEVGTV